MQIVPVVFTAGIFYTKALLKANVDWDERLRLQREKRLGPARGKRPPVAENQQSSVTESIQKI
ncbi:MAG: hypothetical protein ACE3JN_08400 [Ectobacillus sp.]